MRLDQELTEIALLAQQAKTETERHEGRRVKGEERVLQIERDSRPDMAELGEARAQLLTLSRRAALFEGQQQVLEGKQRSLQRFRDRLAALDSELALLDPSAAAPAPRGARPGVAPSGASGSLLRAQEELRKEIARQMHDGPAQSLANIALQAEIVQRLVARGDSRSTSELESLRAMVQHALEATKEFIFDVRPMVLDDLGLVPTLRRTAVDRGRRSGVNVDFDSQGSDRRLSPDLESGVFRIIDDAVSGYLGLHPARITLRLEWTEQELIASVRALWSSSGSEMPSAEATDAESREDLPPALAAMIEQERSDRRQARTVSRSLQAERIAEMDDRARNLGVVMTLLDEGRTIELTVRLG